MFDPSPLYPRDDSDPRPLPELPRLFDRYQEEAAALSASYDRFVDAAWPILSTDPLVREWYVDALCEHVEAWCRREILDLMIHIRPRSGKTILCSVLANAWTWTWDPTAQYLTASYGDDRRTEDARLTRTVIKSEWFQSRWPTPFSDDQGQKHRFSLQSGGHRFTAIWGSATTGDGGSHLIADDPQNAADQYSPVELERDVEWAYNTWDRRRNQPGSTPSMITCQRLGPRDLPNALRANEPQRWEVLSFQTRKTSILTGTYYLWRADGTAQDIQLPLIDTSISRRRVVDRRQPGELLSSRVVASELDALQLRSPSTYEAQEQQTPIRGKMGTVALHLFDRGRNVRSFAQRMGAPNLIGAVEMARGSDWRVTTGWDHGLDARREICHVILVHETLREIWVVATYANQERTTAEQDARGVRLILDGLGIPPRAVVQSRGDVGNAGKGSADAGQSINQTLMQVKTKALTWVHELGREVEIDVPVLGFPIQLPDKGAGSISTGTELLNTGFGGGSLNVDESCELLATAAEQWVIGGERYKDVMDALRYATVPFLRRWFAVGNAVVR